MNISKIHVKWYDSNGTYSADFNPDEDMCRYGLSIKAVWKDMQYGRVLSLKASSNSNVTFLDVTMDTKADMADARVMSNGYQTWTCSTEMDKNSSIKRLSPIVFSLLKPYGDYGIIRHKGKKGCIISWTYTYIRKPGSPVAILGSCSESTGYTLFDIDINNNGLKIIKDCRGMDFSGRGDILSIYIGEGEETEVWDEYCSTMDIYRKPSVRCTGWTSWYNYYTNISEDILLNNLAALSRSKIPMDVFQIDDGYQHAVGDWLDINEKFPSGMKKLADEISCRGYKPGLWLAPFACEKKSYIFKSHPGWLLKDDRGRPVKAGYNPGWSGIFYSLDFYNEEFREYLKKVFRTVLDEWGYEIVKLDFLYAACVIPHHGRSRGQIMTEAMDFIREQVKDKLILGCGVPLGPSFGRVDYCRIGSDVAFYWEDKKLAFVNYRERVSSFNSLISTLGRWQLNGRVFNNDPDVFILRPDNGKMTEDEKYTLFIINNILGNLIFFSDDISMYGERETALIRSMYPGIKPIINSVIGDNNLYRIELSCEGRNYTIFSNMGDGTVNIVLECRYYNEDMFVLEKGASINLRPHQSVVLFKIEACSSPYLIGAWGHMLPGCRIKKFAADGNKVDIELYEGCSDGSKIFIGVDRSMEGIEINGKVYETEERCNIRYAAVECSDL